MDGQHHHIGSDNDAEATEDEWLHGFVASRKEEGVAHIDADIADDGLHAASCHHAHHNAARTLEQVEDERRDVAPLVTATTSTIAQLFPISNL